MLDKLLQIEAKYENTTELLMDPKVFSVQADFQKYSREHAELQPLVEKIREYKKIILDLESTEELLKSGDNELKELALAELDELKKRKPLLESELKMMMLPVDPRDSKNVILEIRAGTGGEEAALFAASLLRMYTKYAESKKWKVELISMNATGLGASRKLLHPYRARVPTAGLNMKAVCTGSSGCPLQRPPAEYIPQRQQSRCFRKQRTLM